MNLVRFFSISFKKNYLIRWKMHITNAPILNVQFPDICHNQVLPPQQPAGSSGEILTNVNTHVTSTPFKI